MPIELVQPSLIVTAAALLFIFVVFAFVSERYANEDIQPAFNPDSLYKPVSVEECEFCQWWTPEAISQRFNEIAVRNENMAAVEGHHNLSQLDNLIIPIVPHWYQRDQEESEI